MTLSDFLAAIEARSVDALRASISPSFAGKANGRPLDREAQVGMIEAFWAGFSDGAFNVQATGGAGHGVMTWTFTGTHDGVYLGIPSTGTKVTLSGFTVAVWNATGLTSLDWKWDTKAFVAQVLGPENLEGAFPLPPQHRPDPSIRWAREAQRQHGRGRKSGQRKPKGGQAQGQRQRPPRAPKAPEAQELGGAAAAPPAAEAAPQSPAAEAAPSAPDSQPEQATPSGPSDEGGSSSP